MAIAMSDSEFDYDYSYGGDGGGDDPSSDEGGVSFVPSLGGRRNRGLRRAAYTTFGDEEDGSIDSEDDDDEEMRGRRRVRRGGKVGGRNEAIYGVFMGSSDDEDGGRKGERRGRKRPRDGSSGPVTFVKSGASAVSDVKEGDDIAKGASDDDDRKIPAKITDDRSSGEDEDEKEDAAAESATREAEDVVARFRSLLERGRKASRQWTRASGTVGPMYRAGASPAALFAVAAAADAGEDGGETPPTGVELGIRPGATGDEDEGKDHSAAEVGLVPGHGGDSESSGYDGGAARLGLGMRPTGLGLSADGEEERPPGLGQGLKYSKGERNEINVAVGGNLGFGGRGGSGQGLGLGSSGFAPAGSWRPPNPKPPVKRDPTLGTWEKHTKGIGMKLLTKMGYSGSGGLGAKRRIKPTPVAGGELDVKVGAVAPAAAASVAVSVGGNELEEIAERKGISCPVEVVIRPANLGLGYGNFTEATKLRSNRQIEAEVRGIDLKKQEEEKRMEERKRREEESLLPGMGALLDDSGWRKITPARVGRRSKTKRKIVSYEDIANEKGKGEGDGREYKVIDMRGPSSSAPSPGAGKDGKVPLGQELLYNLTLLTNSYEERVRSALHFVRSHRCKVESLESDIASTERRVEEMRERATRLERVESIVLTIERLEDDDTERARDLILELCRTFTAAERKELNFQGAVVPALLGPTVERLLEKWDPLRDGAAAAEKMVAATLRLCRDVSDGQIDGGIGSSDGKGLSRRETQAAVFRAHLLPRIKKSFLSSTAWDPVRDVDRGLDVYEAILGTVRSVSPPEDARAKDSQVDEDILMEDPYAGLQARDADDLEGLVKDDVMYEIIFQRLSSSLRLWTSSTYMSEGLEEDVQSSGTLLHSWIVPWLPHLDGRSMLSMMLPDIKRTLRSALMFLSCKRLMVEKDDGGVHFNAGTTRKQEDLAFLCSSVDLLNPWCRILDAKSLMSLTSEVVVPRLGRYLSRMEVANPLVSGSSPLLPSQEVQDWNGVDLLLEMYESSLVSKRDFLSLVEGEVLAAVTSSLYAWLIRVLPMTGGGNSGEDIATRAAGVYFSWKKKLFHPPLERSSQPSDSNPWQVLREDDVVCRHFYAVLLMIKAATNLNVDALVELTPPPRESSNFRSALARRAKEDRRLEEQEEWRRAATAAATKATAEDEAEAFIARRAAVASGITFREVVEDFARQNDVSFRPRMGPKSTKDGKPVFVFGTIPIYLEANVVYALRGSRWQPTHLEDLVLAGV